MMVPARHWRFRCGEPQTRVPVRRSTWGMALTLAAALACVPAASSAAQAGAQSGIQSNDIRPPTPSTTDTLLHSEVPPCGTDGLSPPAPLKLPAELEARRQLLLRGKCALQRGELASAEAIFRQGLGEDKNLPRLWRLYLFAALMQEGRHIEALATLSETLKGPDRNYVKERVRQALLAGGYTAAQPPPADGARLAASSVEDVEFDYLATYLANVRPGAEDYDLIERLLVLAKPRHDDGLMRRLPVLLWRYPKNEAAAQVGMTVLSAGTGSGPGDAATIARASLTGEDFTERERRLTELRLARLVALELGDGPLPAVDPETARKLGRTYFAAMLQLKAYRQAAEALERGVGLQRFAFDGRENATWAVRMALRRRNTQQVLALLKSLEALDPSPDTKVGFYLELAREYETRQDLASMTEWCRRIIAASPGSNAAGTAYWMLVWNRFQRREFDAALDWADKALAVAPALPWDHQARILYWKGRLEQEQGDAEAARQTWAQLTGRWPSTYYGLIAAQAGADPAPARFAKIHSKPDLAAEPPQLDAVWRNPTLSAALFAYAAGEDSAAESLLQDALAQPLPKEMVKELAELFLALNEHHLQQRLFANQGPFDLAQTAVGASPIWRQAFPAAFWDIVVDEAGAQEISPHFILAVMREESRFKVKADSKAGAKGLMQVMPATALELARKRRINLTEATLLLPEFNIPIGALYLHDVLRRFDWNPIYAAAAYNAGPGSVLRWSKEWGRIPFDEFVERIPFEETQAYVKRVYASYLIYRAIYP